MLDFGSGIKKLHSLVGNVDINFLVLSFIVDGFVSRVISLDYGMKINELNSFSLATVVLSKKYIINGGDIHCK